MKSQEFSAKKSPGLGASDHAHPIRILFLHSQVLMQACLPIPLSSPALSLAIIMPCPPTQRASNSASSKCWENWGCWRECWGGCCRRGGGVPWKGMRSSTLASTPASTPNFRSTIPNTLRSLFWVCPFLYSVADSPGRSPAPGATAGWCF